MKVKISNFLTPKIWSMIHHDDRALVQPVQEKYNDNIYIYYIYYIYNSKFTGTVSSS